MVSSQTRAKLWMGSLSIAVEQVRGDQVLGIFEAAPQRGDAAAIAIGVLRRPIVAVAREAGAVDRRQPHLLVAHERVGLQAAAQCREVGEGLERGTGLALGLGRAVVLAQRIGEAARHGENSAGLVVENDRRALHHRAHPQFEPCGLFAPRFGLLDEHDVVESDTPTHRGRDRQHAAVGEADAKPAAVAVFALGAGSEHHRGCPVHVVERRMSGDERLLPGRLALVAGPLDAPDGIAEVCFGAPPFDPAVAHLVLGKPLLKGCFSGVLKVGANRGPNRGPGHREAWNAGDGARFAGHMIDEVVTVVAGGGRS